MNNVDKMKELSEQVMFPPFEGFPDIELYMDQIIDILSRSRTTLRDDDKLSAAMVNNYIKAELLPRAKGKKYSREHLAHLAVIVRLKQVLSVKDTGMIIKASKLGKTDQEFFDSFRNRVIAAMDDIMGSITASKEKPADIAAELAVRSYAYKIACEYVLDMVSDYYWKNPEKLEAEKKDEKSGSGEK